MIFGMASAIEFEDLHFAVAKMLPSEHHHSFILPRSVLAGSPPARSTGFFFKTAQEIFFKPGEPFVECFAGNAEVTSGQGDIFAILLPKNDPFQSAAGRAGQMEKFSGLAPSGVLIPELMSARKVSGFERCIEPLALLLGGCDGGHM